MNNGLTYHVNGILTLMSDANSRESDLFSYSLFRQYQRILYNLLIDGYSLTEDEAHKFLNLFFTIWDGGNHMQAFNDSLNIFTDGLTED